MKNRLLTFLTLALLTLAVPALIAAAPGEHSHSGPKPVVDWKAYPADIQAQKMQLDKIRSEQKALFEQLKSQHDQIRAARKALTLDQRKTLTKPARMLIEQMKSSRDDIRTLRNQKREAWGSFHKHAEGKQWSSAKSDMETIIKQKQQILEKQKGILKLQKQLITLISPSHESHVHTME